MPVPKAGMHSDPREAVTLGENRHLLKQSVLVFCFVLFRKSDPQGDIEWKRIPKTFIPRKNSVITCSDPLIIPVETPAQRCEKHAHVHITISLKPNPFCAPPVCSLAFLMEPVVSGEPT